MPMGTPVRPGDPSPFEEAEVEPTEGGGRVLCSEERPGDPSHLGEQWRRFGGRPGVEEHVRSRWLKEEEDDDEDAIRDPVGLQVLRDDDTDGWQYLVLDGPAMGFQEDGFETPRQAAEAGDRKIAEVLARAPLQVP